MRRTAPLIVGGGPAGSAAAIALARNGVRATLIERTTQAHDPVCGGFLGWDAIDALVRLGVNPWALGAHPITRLRIVAGGRVAETALPHRAAGLSRHVLDAALLARAAQAGAAVSRGVAARRLDEAGLHLADGACLAADSLFLATGKHELRGLQRDSGRRLRVGLRTTLPGQPDLDGTIELHLLDGGYAGLLRQEDGRINLCLSIAGERLAAASGSPDLLLAALADGSPRLADRVATASGEWSAVAAVPYGWRATTTTPGRFRIGDQAAVIASLAGDGIAIALASGRAAATAWLAGGAGAAPAFQHAFGHRAAWPVGAAEYLRHAAERPRWARPGLAMLAMLPGSLRVAARMTRIGA